MSTITAEPLTKTVFMSRSPNQVLTRRATRYVDNGQGGKKEQSYGGWLADQEELNVQRELADGPEAVKPIDDTPWKAEFANSEYQVPDVIQGHTVSEEGKERFVKWLRSHKDINTPHGFWELGNAPDEARPTLTQQFTEIADAAAFGDPDRVQAALQLERDTHNREPVLVAAEAALARFEQIAPESGAEAGTATTDPDALDPETD